MSRILTPKGWKELEEITEHKANKPHKHPHKPYGPFEKEEVKEGPFSSKSNKAGIGDVAPGVRNMGKKSDSEYSFPKSRPGLKDMKKGTTKTNEDDNPANRQHLCAKNVVHEEYGEGQCISEQHAEPDRYGHVAWYDVMFEHGIEERLPVNEVKVTKAEDHIHSSKKMKKGK